VEPTDLTVTILREIRDGIRQTNERLDQTRAELSARIEQTNERLDQTREELAARITQSDIRTATALVRLAGAVDSVKELLADRLDLRDRVERRESDIAELRRRVDSAE
jgi:phage shock protein A